MNDIKKRKGEKKSQQQKRVQLTGQILERLEQVCVRARAHSFLLSLCLFRECARAYIHARAMFVFCIVFDVKEAMCVNILAH